ncbi:MAG: hypothetical protein EA401_03430 [Planctomycetota bacterium]|nr:MAG: hypothetical protein EA401_03430 [Planctomycetota bacterium]
MEPSDFLARVRRRLRTIVALDGSARLLLLLLLSAAALVLLDYTAPMPGILRLACLIALAGAFVSVAHRYLWRPLRHPLDTRVLSQLVERRMPELNGALYTHVDGVELSANEYQALRAHLRTDRLPALLRVEHTLRRGLAAVVLVLAVMALSVTHADWMGTAVRRLLLPMGATQWPYLSALEAHLERSVIAADEPLVLRAERRHGPPGSVVVRWHDQDGVQDSRVLGSLTGPWRELLSLGPGDYTIYLESRDAATLRLQARVVERPRLSVAQAQLTPPSYTGAAPSSLDSLADLAELAGSSLDFWFRVRSGPEAAKHHLAVTWNDAAIDMDPENGRYRGSLELMEDGELAVDVVDYYHGTGYGAGDADGDMIAIAARPSIGFSLSAVADRPPQVSLHGVRNGEAVSADARLDLRISASDDVALETLSLLATVERPNANEEGDAPAERTLATLDGVAGMVSTERDVPVDLDGLVRVGDVLRLQAKAEDGNDITGPGRSRSQVRSVRVVSEDALRRDLDQQLLEARDRVVQSRELLSRGLSDADRVTDAARGSQAVARRAHEQLEDVVRRWRANRLDPEREERLSTAMAVLADEALTEIAQAGASGHPDPLPHARQADAALGESARQLSALLQSDDLYRQLDNLIRRQDPLVQESREVVIRSLRGSLDADGQDQRQHLQRRQQEIAEQLRDWERRLAASDSSALTAAQELATREQPADLLRRAATALDHDRPQQGLVGQQDNALSIMRELLELLQGTDVLNRLAQEAAQLADRQEALEQALARGADPRALGAEQEELSERSEQLRQRIAEATADDSPASEAMEGARAAQRAAEEQLQASQSRAAQQSAAAAAAQLRAASQELGQDDGAGEEDQAADDEEESGPDVLALLRDLVRRQTRVVTQATVLHRRFTAAHEASGGTGAYQQLEGFAQRRSVQDQLAGPQSDILLLLREKGLQELEQQPIAHRALQRVETAVKRASDHFDSPALQERGVRLATIALYEMRRLLAIAADLPSPQQSEDDDDNGGGEADGGGDQAPFPPAAELALLRAEQEDVAWLTRTRQPLDLATRQQELAELVEFLMNSSRSGSRPHLLLQRTHRAMSSARHRLSEMADDGTITQDEQDLAVASLTQLLLEAAASGGSSGGQQPPSQDEEDGDDGESSPRQADGDEGSDAASGDAGGVSQAQGQTGQEQDLRVRQGQTDDASLLHLPPDVRGPLIEALNDQSLPPEARAVLRRYFELLED